MGFLRNNDALDPAEDAPARLANCDDLRPLEQDNCLWDILLLHRYVEFTVQPPYAPKALECAAVHALLEPGRNPAQDKTVAEFLGVSKAAVSQRRKTWQQRLMQMQADISGAPVNRPMCVETTAMGAAYLAGLAVGYWKSKEDVIKNWAIDRTFEPEIAAEDRAARIKGWNKAVKCSYGWAKDE